MCVSRRVLTGLCIGLLLLALVVVKVTTSNAAGTRGQAASVSSMDAVAKRDLIADHRELGVRLNSSVQEPKPKTIGEVEKNIKVLGEFPQTQLIPMMNVMAASLGVRCNYCHVNRSGQWDYAADEKPEKNTAREMITMTLGLNKVNAAVNKEVSCYTCHRGRTSPASVISLPLPEPPPRGQGGPGGQRGTGGQAAPGGAAQGAPTPSPLPSADDILNKYVTALGGQAAIDKLKTKSMTGTFSGANGITANFQVEQAAPDKFHVSATFEGGGMERGFNGTAGWEKSGANMRDLPPPALADLKAVYGMFADVKLKQQFTRMTVRKDKLNDRDVFVVMASTADGRRERLYFDAEGGLLLRRASATQTPLGIVPQQTDFEDYRDVDGVKLPFTIKSFTIEQGTTGTRKYSEIKINPTIDDSKFNKPSAPATP